MIKRVNSYYISGVLYNPETTSITQLEVLLVPSSPKDVYDLSVIDNAERTWQLREDIVKQIKEEDAEYFTVYLADSEQHYESGALIHIISIDDEDYLRTDKNNIKEDNLGDLPRK